MNARRGGWGKRSSRVLRSPVVKGRDCFRQTLSHMEYIMSRQSVWVCFVILLGNRDTEFICFCHRKAGICFTYWLLITLKNSLLNPRHFHCLLTVLKWWQIPEAWGFSFLFEWVCWGSAIQHPTCLKSNREHRGKARLWEEHLFPHCLSPSIRWPCSFHTKHKSNRWKNPLWKINEQLLDFLFLFFFLPPTHPINIKTCSLEWPALRIRWLLFPLELQTMDTAYRQLLLI